MVSCSPSSDLKCHCGHALETPGGHQNTFGMIRDEPGILPDPPGDHITRLQELIARAPILAVGSTSLSNPFTQTYIDDRSKVWELLSTLTRDLECWSYVMPSQKNRDGRSTFLNLKIHYLGVNNVNNMAATVENRLQTNSYNGQTRKWNFEKYVRMHVDQHAILHRLREHGYAGINKRTMVRYLTVGIMTTSLDHVKTRILSDAGLGRTSLHVSICFKTSSLTKKQRF